MARILVTAKSLKDQADAAYLNRLRAAGHEAAFAEVPGSYLDEPGLRRQLPGVAGVMASSEPYTREIFDKFPDLRVIARLGVGYDAVDLDAAADHEVPVLIAGGSNDTTVAESAVALMLSLARGLPGYFERTGGGDWTRPSTTELRDKTVGLIGLGRVGRAVVERLAGFRVQVVAAELYPDPEFVERHAIELVDVDAVFRRADFLSLHAPLTPDTAALVNAQRLASMQAGAFIVNTARGGLVDEDALYAALESGQIAGAALDVRGVEPPTDPKLAAHPLVVATPHMAGVSRESLVRMSDIAAQNVIDVLNGAWDRANVVNGVFAE